MAKYRGRFIEGSKQNNISAKLSGEIFDTVEKFAGYGFNKAHSAAYAVIAAQTAYLKANYPVEFMAAFCTTEMNNTERVVYNIIECRREGIPVLPPDINISDRDFMVEDHDGVESVRFGLGAIKNLGHGAAESILATRAGLPDGKFPDLDAFCSEINWSAINRRAVEAIAKAGALDGFGSRASVLTRLESAIQSGQQRQKAASRGQMGLFDLGALAQPETPSTPSVHDDGHLIPKRDLLSWEKEHLGLYMSGHPLNEIFEKTVNEGVTSIVEIPDREPGVQVRVVGMVSGVRRVTTKKNRTMAIIELEDLTGTIELVAFPDTYDANLAMWEPDKIVEVMAKVDRRSDKPQLICESVTDQLRILGVAAPPPCSVNLRLPLSEDYHNDVRLMQRVDELLKIYEGDDEVVVTLVNGISEIRLKSRSRRVEWSDQLEGDLTVLLGKGSVVHHDPGRLVS